MQTADSGSFSVQRSVFGVEHGARHAQRSTLNAQRRRRARGFSLIELMVVITILALLAGVVSVQLFSAAGKGRKAKVQADIEAFKTAIKLYRLEKHKLPSELRELLEPTKDYPKGFLEATKIPKDPWGNDYVYQKQDSTTFLLKSLGANGQEGGEGEDADISNQDEDE